MLINVSVWLSFLVAIRLSKSIGIFPKKFKFGIATSSYQIEGAWDADGKGENIWDHMCHTNPNFIHNQDNGDIACDSYHKWQEDLDNIKSLNVDFYRFSLSWSRILPTGRVDRINQIAIDYYKKIINGLISRKIEPIITLYHWDLPQPLQKIGGWLNPKIITIFRDYSRLAFKEFGDNVKTWITFNEPKQVCLGGYGEGSMAPGINATGRDDYKCAHTLLKAHAKAWHLYDDEFRKVQNGRISITIDGAWLEPFSNKIQDIEAAERARQFIFGWFGNPVYNRNYPQVMIDRIDARSRKQNFSESRLPKFTEQELDYISGTHDFFGINVYTAAYVYGIHDKAIKNISYASDLSIGYLQDSNWPNTSNPSLKVVPWAMRKLLNWLKNTYNNPEILITENGYGDSGDLVDINRINYYRDYLENLLDAIYLDKVNCTAYTAWSLMDNFEWTSGYQEKYGFFYVDFNDTAKTRTPKLSAHWFSIVARTHILF